MALKSKNGKVAGKTTEDVPAEDEDETDPAENGDEIEDEATDGESEEAEEEAEGDEAEEEGDKPAFKPITTQAELQARINKAVQKRLARERKKVTETPPPAKSKPKQDERAASPDADAAELLALLREEKIQAAKAAIKGLPKNLQALVPWEVDSLGNARKVLEWVAKAAPKEGETEPVKGNLPGPKGQIKKNQPKLTAEELAERARKSRLYRW